MESDDLTEELAGKKKFCGLNEDSDGNIPKVKEDVELAETTPEFTKYALQDPPSNGGVLAEIKIEGGNLEDTGATPKENEYEELQRLKGEYFQLKEQIRNDELTFINNEIKQIEAGEHEEVNSQINLLKLKKEKKIFLAEQMHKHKCDSVTHALAADIQFAMDEFEAEVKDLKERSMRMLIKKCKQYEGDKGDLLNGESKAYSTRTLRKRDKESPSFLSSDNIRMKALELQIKLTEEEIVHDLVLISKVRLERQR